MTARRTVLLGLTLDLLVPAVYFGFLNPHPVESKKNACTTIQSGELAASDRSTIEDGHGQR